MHKRILVIVLLVIVSAASSLTWLWSGPSPAKSILAKHYAVATANPYASDAAAEILHSGGSAVDAAITAQLVLTLVEPQSSGIGGGLFLLVSDAHGNVRAYDGRETAPASARPDMFLGRDRKPQPLDDVATGGLTVGVPGVIAALELAHHRYGKLAWAQLFTPAIRLAENGFLVSPRLARAIAELDRNRLGDKMRRIYFHPDGTPLRAGETLRNPQLAKTLRTIAREGRAGFYQGEVAEAIVASVHGAHHNVGNMTLEDLRGYRALEREPICQIFQSYRICTTPAPSGGVTVLQILGMLAGQPANALALGSLSQIHLLSQAERLAYADRAKWLADPAFIAVPTAGLLDQTYLRARANLIDAGRDMGRAEAGAPLKKRAHVLDFAPQRTRTLHGTSHLVIMDANGVVVSMTSSVQAGFGAQICAAGFVLNNELTDFSLEPTVDGRVVANAPAPGKRPLSAMSPAIVFDRQGRFFAAIGSPGGHNIIPYNAQALLNLITAQASMAATVSAPHFANLNGPTVIESGTSLMARAPLLVMMGHSIRVRQLESGLNGIRRTNASYEAASDPRGEGAVRAD